MLFIDFLNDGAPECPMLRIYGTDVVALSSLHQHFEALGNGTRSRVEVHELDRISCQVGLHLCCMASDANSGVVKAGSTLHFTLSLGRPEWTAVCELIHPLIKVGGQGGFQWVVAPGARGSIAVLLSATEGGEW